MLKFWDGYMWGSRIKLQWLEKRLIIGTDILVQNIHLPCPDHVVCPCVGIDILFTPSTRWSYFWRLLCHLVVVLLVFFLFQTPPMSKPLSLLLALTLSNKLNSHKNPRMLAAAILDLKPTKISHNFLIYSYCFNTSQKSFKFRFNEILLSLSLSLSFQGFFKCNFQKTITKLQIHLVLGFFIPSFQMISITSWWSHYFFFLSSHPNRLQKGAATITDSNEKLPNSGTLSQFCNLEVGFLEIDQQQQQ